MLTNFTRDKISPKLVSKLRCSLDRTRIYMLSKPIFSDLVWNHCNWDFRKVVGDTAYWYKMDAVEVLFLAYWKNLPAELHEPLRIPWLEPQYFHLWAWMYMISQPIYSGLIGISIDNLGIGSCTWIRWVEKITVFPQSVRSNLIKQKKLVNGHRMWSLPS